MSSSFSLDIKSGQGLSYAIDAALDKEFQQDIQLNKLKQWNTIFEYIKEDQAEQTQANQKQFSSKDNDIKNNSHYQVNEGCYNITQNAWNKIVKYVSEELKIELPVKQDDKKIDDATEDQTLIAPTKNPDTLVQEKIEANKTAIQNYISPDYKFEELNKTLQNDILKKYAMMLDYAQQNGQTIDDNTMSVRLKNYIKGWEYHTSGIKALHGIEINPIQVFDENADEGAQNKGLDDLTAAYIEYYDINGDGNIDAGEALYTDYNDSLRYNLPKQERKNAEEAHKKAIEVYNQYKAGMLKPNEDGTPEEKFLQTVLDNIEYMDLTTALNDTSGENPTDGILKASDIKAILETQVNLNSKGKSNEIDGHELTAMSTLTSKQSVPLYERLMQIWNKQNPTSNM